jgi:uncharacterized protein YhbP (UPF0306 family)
MYPMEEDIRKQILDYMGSHSVCTIAVADGNRPSAHTVYYANRGLRLYFESDPQSQKIHVLMANPQISLTIDEDYPDVREIKGIQLFGRASIVKESQASKLRDFFSSKFPSIRELGGVPSHHLFVEVLPEKIYFIDFSKGLGHRVLYHVEDASEKPTDGKSNLMW